MIAGMSVHVDRLKAVQMEGSLVGHRADRSCRKCNVKLICLTTVR